MSTMIDMIREKFHEAYENPRIRLYAGYGVLAFAVLLSITLVATLVSPLVWWADVLVAMIVLSLLAVATRNAFLARQRKKATPPPEMPPDPTLPSDPDEIEAVAEPLAGFEADDDENQEYGLITRHWWFCAKHLVAHFSMIVVFAGIGLALLLQDRFQVSPSAWNIYILLLAMAIPVSLYAVKRELFRWRNTLVRIVGDELIQHSPDSRFYFFTGGTLAIPILETSVMEVQKRDLLELFIFRKKRTVTIDTNSTMDAKLHDMRDVVDAEEKLGIISRRKRELVRLSGNSVRK